MKLMHLFRQLRVTFALLSVITYLNLLLFIFSSAVLIFFFIKLGTLQAHLEHIRQIVPSASVTSVDQALGQLQLSHTFLFVCVGLLLIFGLAMPLILLLTIAFLLRAFYGKLITNIKRTAALFSKPMQNQPLFSRAITTVLSLLEIWFEGQRGWIQFLAPLLEIFRSELSRPSDDSAQN